MTGELAAGWIALATRQVVRIDGYQSLLLRRRRREAHGPGNVEHQVEIDVGGHIEG